MRQKCMCLMKTTGIFQGTQTSTRPTERSLKSRLGIGWAEGQDLRCEEELPWIEKKLISISSFEAYPIIPRILFELVFANVAQISNKFPKIYNKFPTIRKV